MSQRSPKKLLANGSLRPGEVLEVAAEREVLPPEEESYGHHANLDAPVPALVEGYRLQPTRSPLPVVDDEYGHRIVPADTERPPELEVLGLLIDAVELEGAAIHLTREVRTVLVPALIRPLEPQAGPEHRKAAPPLEARALHAGLGRRPIVQLGPEWQLEIGFDEERGSRKGRSA